MTEDRLRELYGRALAEDVARAEGEACVEPDEILRLIRRQGSEEERLRVLNHVMACERCRQGYELLKSVESAGAMVMPESGTGDVARSEPEPRDVAVAAPASADDAMPVGGGEAGVIAIESRRGPRRLLPFALAASVVLVVGVGVLTRVRSIRQPEAVRGGADAVVLLAPAEDVAASARIVFAWRPVSGARRYELQLLDAQGSPRFRAATTDTTAASVTPPAGAYRWLVRALLDGGAEVTSPARPLRVR